MSGDRLAPMVSRASKRLLQNRSGESYGRDFRAPERSVRQYVSTGAQKIAPRRPPERFWWAREDLNLRPHAYQACALTN
jgi:hypothetical protein